MEHQMQTDVLDTKASQPSGEILSSVLPFVDVEDLRDFLSPCFIKRLPQELLDAIVDCLRKDKRSLATCTLILRQWVYRARVHLFDTVYVGRTQSVQRFFDFLRVAPPSVTRNIDRLTLYSYHDDGIDLTSLVGAMARIPSLNELWLRRFTAVFPFTVSANITEPRTARLNKLVLDRASMTAVQLADLVAAFPGIQELYVETDCRIVSSSLEAISSDTVQSLSMIKLEKLALGSHLDDHKAIMDVVHLTSAVHPLSITKLELNFLQPSWLPTAKGILRESGDNLEKLAIDLTSFVWNENDGECELKSLGLSSCVKLQHLRLDLHNTHEISWVQDILSDVLRRELQLRLCVDVAIAKDAVSSIGAWDRVFSTYNVNDIGSFRIWCRTENRRMDRSNAFKRGRLLNAEEQVQVRKLLPETDKVGTLKFA